ncbi:PREDICTED: spidroin-2-like [Chinchilla lanigera]|uniref:spidroin-2-like n=1 Tax=Chinchilla lanigera TaxID=34839 RepID=UPI000698AA3D|nr:PREDICTED: spidroin-2-like [Chinchilla lanigera]
MDLFLKLCRALHQAQRKAKSLPHSHCPGDGGSSRQRCAPRCQRGSDRARYAGAPASFRSPSRSSFPAPFLPSEPSNRDATPAAAPRPAQQRTGWEGEAWRPRGEAGPDARRPGSGGTGPAQGNLGGAGPGAGIPRSRRSRAQGDSGANRAGRRAKRRGSAGAQRPAPPRGNAGGRGPAPAGLNRAPPHARPIGRRAAAPRRLFVGADRLHGAEHGGGAASRHR